MGINITSMNFKTFFMEKWYDTRGEPMDEVSKMGYFEADDLLGKRVWIHTNRTNAKNGRNGMIGVYVPAEHKKTKRFSNERYGYTNDIRLSDVFFDTDKKCLELITSGQVVKRTLCAGILGTIINTEGDDSGYVEFQFDPVKNVKWNYLVGDSEKKEIISASEVHLIATEDGHWIKLVKNPVFKNE
jgi:hypothetical protein